MDDATSRRRRLGRALRQARQQAGLTQVAVAKVLRVGQAKINKIEATLVSISPGELEKLVELYQLPAEEAEELTALALRDLQEGSGRTGWSAFTDLTELEAEASEMRSCHSERIPGILQSERYALRQYELSEIPRAVIDQSTTRRLARTDLFARQNPPQYRAILSESSLHRMPGGRSAELVADQAGHLLRMMEDHGRVEIRILTFDANVPYIPPDFILLSFDGKYEDLVYIEYIGGSRMLKSRREFTQFRQYWEVLEQAALSADDTKKFLKQFAL